MAPQIHVDGNPSLADEPISITVTGLDPHQTISLLAKSQMPGGALFESISHYAANASGFISLKSDESYGGTYKGVWPMGPLSFMVPSSSNKRKHERFMIKDPMKPFIVSLRIYDSFIPTMEEIPEECKFLAELDITRTYVSPKVIEQEIMHERIRGTLYLPAEEGKYPGVISMSGGYPGAMKHKAALLASHGFVALALRYFGTDDLPADATGVQLSYLVETAQYLKNHPNVDGRNGVGIIANCAGATLAYATAACAPDGLVGCLVAISGWFFSFSNLEYGGQHWKAMFPIDVDSFMKGPEEGTYIYDYNRNVKSRFLPSVALPEDGHFAFYKRLNTAFMLVHGGLDADLNNNALELDQLTRDLLKSAGHRNHKILYYPNAGHMIEHAYFPFAKVVWTLRIPRFYGGIQPEHSVAQEDSWPKIINFVKRNLMKHYHKL